MVLEYLPTFTPKMAQFCKYSSTMEHLGIERINSSATYFGHVYPLLK